MQNLDLLVDFQRGVNKMLSANLVAIPRLKTADASADSRRADDLFRGAILQHEKIVLSAGLGDSRIESTQRVMNSRFKKFRIRRESSQPAAGRPGQFDQRVEVRFANGSENMH